MSYIPELMSGMKPKERFLSYAYAGFCLRVCTKLSYRESVELINTAFHRNKEDALKLRTLADYIESYGTQIGTYVKTMAESVLAENGFNPTTGLPEDAGTASDTYAADPIPATPEERESRQSLISENVAAINADREKDAQINSTVTLVDEELPGDSVCYISIDDIGVKRQKTTRKDGGSKGSRYVENTVIHVQDGAKNYVLTAIGLDNAFKILLAFLLSNGLMNRRLIFFADGAKSIKTNIEKYFSFRTYTLILDWYHLKKKCKELISSSIKGSIEQKKEISKALLRILWAGNADAAVRYLNNLPESKVKSDYWLAELTGYLERKKPQIVCYALRHRLGLRISSNRVEKSNDLLVAERQKHNGMSWSVAGSSALASIAMTFHNGEAEQWLRSHSLSFAMLDKSAA